MSKYYVQANRELVQGWIGPLVRADGHKVIWVDVRKSIYSPGELFFDLERSECRARVLEWLAGVKGLDASRGVHFSLYDDEYNDVGNSFFFKIRVYTFHSALWAFEGMSNDALEALKQVVEYEVSRCS